VDAEHEQSLAAKPDRAAGWAHRSGQLFPWIVVGLVCVGASIRIGMSLTAPAFTDHDPISLFRSDPALLYYVTERIIDGGGWPPDDFRADPRIEHPETTDIPAMFTVGQEFLVAWGYLLFGFGLPLHLFALCFMSIVASTAVVGVAGLSRELTGSREWACLAGLVYAVTAGSYRTIGVILIREDLSLPLFALHLYLLARAVRVKSVGTIAAAAVTAVAALATWHAMSFIFTIEVACIFAWFLRTGENPMRGKASGIVLVIFAVGGLLIPVLLSKLFLFSLPVQMLLVMAMMPFFQRRLGTGDLRRAMIGLLSLAAVGLVFSGSKAWLAPGSGDYAHVLEMMLAKVRYLGTRPRDPLELSYDARLIWAGVFETSSPQALMSWLGALVFLTSVSAFGCLESWWHGKGDGRTATLAAFAAMALVLALMLQRLFALAVVLSPPLAVILLRSSFRGPARRHWVLALVLMQCVISASVLDRAKLQSWYNPDLLRQLAGTLHYIQDELPDEGAIAADFIVSAAVIAQSAHPSVLQPKYETARSRNRIERFTNGLYHESPAEFREILRRDFDARYLLVDAPFLLKSRYAAGIPLATAKPPLGSAAYLLLQYDRKYYGTVPGYRLLYESHPRAPRFRLYDLADPDEAGMLE
jgi:hypothetical protein